MHLMTSRRARPFTGFSRQHTRKHVVYEHAVLSFHGLRHAQSGIVTALLHVRNQGEMTHIGY